MPSLNVRKSPRAHEVLVTTAVHRKPFEYIVSGVQDLDLIGNTPMYLLVTKRKFRTNLANEEVLEIERQAAHLNITPSREVQEMVTWLREKLQEARDGAVDDKDEKEYRPEVERVMRPVLNAHPRMSREEVDRAWKQARNQKG